MAKTLAHIAEPLRELAVSVEELVLDPANARHGHATERIAESLRQYGQRKPIVVNRRQGNKVEAGNGTLLAARSLGWEKIAAVFVDDDAATAAAYGIADNRTGELSEWDPDALQELTEVTGDLFTGFEDDELAELFGIEEEPGPDTAPQIDRAEELREQWGVQPGQLWQLGDHRLICGDCTDAETVRRVLQGDVPLLMVTDPPYGVNYDADWRNRRAAEGWFKYADGTPAYAARRVGEVPNDDRIDWSDAYNLFPGDVAYTWSPGGDPVILTGLALQGCGYEIRNQIMWRKPHFPVSRGHYTYQHEPCWYGVKKGKTAHWIGDHNASTVWEITLDKNVEGGHSTQKPLDCMARPIANHDSEFVYEPFCGSGTTIIAGENLGRKCRAIEISPAYVAVALQRWAEHTGGVPELVE